MVVYGIIVHVYMYVYLSLSFSLYHSNATLPLS